MMYCCIFQRAAPMYSQVHEQMPAPLYMGSGTGGPPSMQMGLAPNYGVPMGIPSAAGLPYEYTSSLNMPSSYNTIPMQSSYAPPPSALMGGGKENTTFSNLFLIPVYAN